VDQVSSPLSPPPFHLCRGRVLSLLGSPKVHYYFLFGCLSNISGNGAPVAIIKSVVVIIVHKPEQFSPAVLHMCGCYLVYIKEETKIQTNCQNARSAMSVLLLVPLSWL